MRYEKIYYWIYARGLLFGCIGVYATIKITADQIEYSAGVSVKDKIDDLYSRSFLRLCKFIDNTYGSKGQIGSKYKCKLWDGETRYFYILTINSDNTVDMILDRNIALDTYDNAINYFTTGSGSSYMKTTSIGIRPVITILKSSLYE